MHTLILAIQFLTRLPTPQLKTFDPKWLADSARWFAIVGLIIGGLLYAAAWAGMQIDPWLGAILALLVWAGVSGGLHLDGLSDLADALGAAHSNPQRFHEVLKDPHMGSFGAITLVMQLLTKLVLLMLVCKYQLIFGLILVPAWARLFAVIWAATLPVKSGGSGERFAWRTHWPLFWLNVLLLGGLSAWLAQALLVAPLVCIVWWLYLKYRIGGQTGDCLGAGIEISESLLLLALLLPMAKWF